MNQMPDYRKTYTLDKRYVDQMSSLKNDIEAISFLKRDLDSYIDTSNKQPYTVVYKKVTDLQREIKKVDQTMQDYSTYLDSLKTKSQEIYVGLRNYYLKLKKAQYQMKNQIGVDSFSDSEAPTFKALYDEIAVLDQLLITQPVDVPKASEEFAPFVSQCDELVSVIEKKSIECKNAETAIVYANAYRVEYTDSRPLLDTAEKAFNEGDFDRALENALSVIKSFSAQQQNTAATTQP
jgi:septation ring formation regulator EzrA